MTDDDKKKWVDWKKRKGLTIFIFIIIFWHNKCIN